EDCSSMLRGALIGRVDFRRGSHYWYEFHRADRADSWFILPHLRMHRTGIIIDLALLVLLRLRRFSSALTRIVNGDHIHAHRGFPGPFTLKARHHWISPVQNFSVAFRREDRRIQQYTADS